MTSVILEGVNGEYFARAMGEINRSWWGSNVMGAFYGTALFYAVLAVLLAAETEGLTGLPTALETLAIYLFFFSVLWVSKRPLWRNPH